MAKAGDRAVNEPGVERVQALIVQPIGGQAAHFEVFYQHIALRGHLADERLALGLGHVDGNGALVAVTRGEVAGMRGVCTLRILQKRWPPVARVVARAGALYLHHIGPQVGQHLGTPRACKHTRQVQYFEVGQGGLLFSHARGFRVLMHQTSPHYLRRRNTTGLHA